MSFWDDLYNRNVPVIGLSPMDGVTDAAMRYMSAKYGTSSARMPVNQSTQNESKREIGFTDLPVQAGLRINDGVDVLFTEFVSVDALKHASDPIKVDRVMRAFIRARDVASYSRLPVNPYSQTEIKREDGFMDLPAQAGLRIHDEYPYEVAQVFGHTPELFYQAAVMIATLGYDGMDINMGCPMHKVEDQGSGAGLIRTPEVAQAIVLASKKGMEDFAAGKVMVSDLDVSENVKKWVAANKPTNQQTSKVLPVSVKTRIGVTHSVVEEWMATLMEVEPANISLHGRTLRQLYQGSADWTEIAKAAAVVHQLGGHLLGNGDISSIDDLVFKIKEYGVDGGLIGRAAEGNPAIFKYSSTPVLQLSSDQQEHGYTGTRENVIRDQRLAWAVEHAKVYEKLFKEEKQQSGNTPDFRWYLPMRKHLAWYAHGFPGAVELRMELMKTISAADVERVVNSFEAGV